MPNKKFYNICSPTLWALPPSVYSFTSLGQIENCPLAWQLQNSQYGDFDRYPSRPVPAAIEGLIIHAVLEKFFRELARHGMPAIGTEMFQKVLKQLAIIDLITQLVTEHQKKIASHPRGAGFRLKLSVQELHNKFVRIFKEQYVKLRNVTALSLKGIFDRAVSDPPAKYDLSKNYLTLLDKHEVLTEIPLTHPKLPVKGILDFVWKDNKGIVISDFKSGAPKPEHKEQLLMYAVLWEANTGIIPYMAYIVYPDSSTSIEITKDIHAVASNSLADRVQRAETLLRISPANSIVSSNCQFCTVRHMCDSYWKALVTQKQTFPQCGDVEIEVSGIPGEYGLVGLCRDGRVVNLVYDKDVVKIFGPFIQGDKLRVLAALTKDDTYEVKPWTEVFCEK